MEQHGLTHQERGRLWVRLGIRLVLLTAVLLFLVLLAPPLLSLFMPFVLSFVVAWLLHPLIRWLHTRLHLPRGFLSMLLIALVFAAVGGALALFVYSTGRELISLSENSQAIWRSAQATVIALGESMEKWFAYLPQEMADMVDSGVQSFLTWLQTALPTGLAALASRAGSFAMSIPSFAVASVVFVMGTYFITADYPRIRFMVTDRLPHGVKTFLGHIRDTAVAAFGGYVRAQLILSLVVFSILLVGFLITRQPYALLLALILAILDFIPIIGSGTAMVPWAVVDLFTGNYAHAVGLMVIWGIISVFRRAAEPKILGSQTGLSPILSLVSIYVGMRLAGVMGMILGPVLCLVAQNLAKTGLFSATVADLRLAVQDTAALLQPTSPEDSKISHDSFKKD